MTELPRKERKRYTHTHTYTCTHTHTHTGNHPLAGKVLNFEVTVEYVNDRAKVLADKMKEMDTILGNPLFGMLAREVTKVFGVWAFFFLLE